MKEKAKKTIADINFDYCGGCEYTYDEYRPCQEGSDCCDDDYCRCTQIIDKEITVAPDMETVTNMVASIFGFTSDIDLYGCNRLLTIHKAYDTGFYYLASERDYYGETPAGVFFESPSALEKDLIEFSKIIGTRGKVEFLLEKEYGHLLDCVKDKTWEIKKVDKSEVRFPNDSYHKKAQKEIVEEYKNFKLPCGICLKTDNGYRLIDGYHRLSLASENEVTIIVGE